MLIEDGRVSALHVESPGACEISRGDAVLERLAS
jgi:peroxiredoxin